MRLKVVGTAASLLAGPGVSLALGLGDIQLKSTLNAPLNAEIELIATPEELASLRTQIASRDAFSRYGLDYPAFLTGIAVKPVRLADGRTVVQLTSTQAMTEPFATLLVEATWARGRNLREYTVLFDPPVFAPQNAPSAPVAAATTGGGERSGTIARPAPAAAPAAPVAATGASGGTYDVRGGDSLSGIAQRQYGAAQTDRGMIAIYRANPQAFEGNINVLRAGSVLRLPDQAAVAAVDPGDAAAEVRRQAAAWTGGARSGGAAPEARLRLVPPGSPGAGGNSADTQALRDRVSQLETELAESRRLLELRNSELARLQSSGRNPAPAPAPAAPPAPATPPAATPAPPAAAETPAADATPAVTEPAAAEPAKPTPPKRAAKPKPAPEPEAPSVLDRLKEFWFVPAGLVLLLAALAGVRALRRRRESRPDMMAPFAVNLPDAAERDTSSDTFPLRKPVLDRDDPSIVVEESGTHERPTFPKKDTRTVDLDEGTASMIAPALDATAALEQGDPLAEADFHMAYGLYDQAADLVKMAIQREPGRRDLKLKLLEVFFVWGNKDQFLQTARDLADSRDQAQPGEWEKVVIMGKQLAPEDALFSQSYSGAGPATVDLNLEGGQNLIDFDLHGEPGVSLTTDGGVDMDLGSTMPGSKIEPTLDAGLDFMLDDPARGNDDDLARTATTRQMVQPGFDGEIGTMKLPVEPTVEQPMLDGGATVIGKLDAQANFIGGDQTAELALDDLGLDLGKLDSTNESMLDDSRLTQALSSPDAPTLVAGLDETSRRLIESSDANQPTELLPLGNLADAGETSRVALLDFELDADAETGKRVAMSETDFNLDLDVGSADQPVDGEYQRTQRIEPMSIEVDSTATEQELEPVTMSEVGTKLDLARAYMDMGDPDGARSILTEVLQEGSSSQKQEAQRLIDSIPG
jgi:pilus assembly protein FimV